MKFLVHSSDCAYNTITKRWVCNLAQRFSNPTEFTLVAGSYRCSTADSYPIAVYLRSEALQKLCKTHHSIELAPHEIISDAFGILRMSDSSDVFHLESRFHFPVHSHLTEQKLDFYFTDNRTLLNGVYTPPMVQGVTDTMMEAHATADDIVVWIDMAQAGAVLDFSNNQSVIDGVVGKIISRVPGGSLQLNAAGGSAANSLKYVAIGECRGIAQAGAANGYAVGSYALNPDLAAGHHFLLFQSLSNANSFDVLWQSGSLHVFVYSGTIQFKNEANAYVDTGITVLDSTDYLLEFEYTADEVTGQTQVRLTKLSDDTTISAADQGPLQDPDGTGRWYSTAQDSLGGTLSDYVHCTSQAADDVRNYLKQKYKGEATVPVVDPNGKDAVFQLELDIDIK